MRLHLTREGCAKNTAQVVTAAGSRLREVRNEIAIDLHRWRDTATGTKPSGDLGGASLSHANQFAATGAGCGTRYGCFQSRNHNSSISSVHSK